MVTAKNSHPVILALSAHDPSGAAGIQADIETINNYQCHCVSVITALTAQNTAKFESILPQNPMVFRDQAELLLADINIQVCKIGLIGSELLIHEIAQLLNGMDNVPVVLDPVLHSGTGSNLSSEDIVSVLPEKLFPITTVLTPNIKEAIALSGKTNLEDAAKVILDKGCNSVLITGADQESKNVVNVLYMRDHKPVEFIWERLDGSYHGSGCTLASAISAEIALGNDIPSAVKNAQEFTYATLKNAVQLGEKQSHPHRRLNTK